MEALIIGIATAFNVLIIKVKIMRGRYEDTAIDVGSFLLLAALFHGTMGGMIIATIASAIISITLLFSPPTFKYKFDSTAFMAELKDRLSRE